MPGQSLTDLYIQLWVKDLDVLDVAEEKLAALETDASAAGQAFANLAANSAKGLGEMENRPRLVAAALKVLTGEARNLGDALAGIQSGGGQVGTTVGSPGTGAAASKATGSGAASVDPVKNLNVSLLAGAVAQLNSFTTAATAAEAKTAALMYAMQSPSIKGYAVALANASAVQTEFDASINLERLKGLSTLLASPAFQKTSFLAGVAEQLNGFTASTTAAQAKAEALSQAIGSGAAARYGQALAAAGKEQEKFTAAVRFEQISAQSGRFAASLDALKGKMAQLGQATSSAFGGATSMITSFARAGLSGTTMGERLGLQFQLLSREIASLFIPVLERVIGVLQSVTSWFRSLSGPQQAFIGGIATAGIVLVAMATILPRIIGGLQGMAAVFTILSANPLLAVAAAIAALLVGTEEGRGSLGRLAAAFAPLMNLAVMLARAFAPLAELFGHVLPPIIGALTLIVEAMATAIKTIIEGVIWLINRFRDIPIASPFADTAAQQRGGRDRHEVAGTTKGREGLEATFLRFQEAALKTGQGDTAMRQLTEAQRQTALLRQMTGNMSEPAPPAIG